MNSDTLLTSFRVSKRQTRNSIIAAALIITAAAALFYWLSYIYILRQAEENITNLLLSHKGIHHYVQNTLIPAYTRYQVEGKIPSTFYAPELLSSSYIVRNQHSFYNQERKRAGLAELYYKLAADNPRNPVNKADALENELITMFNLHRDVKSYRKIIEIENRKTLYVAIPFLENQKHCMICHGNREAAPVELQQRYPGQGGFNEKIGEIRAITSIRSPIEHEYTHIYIIALTILVGFITFLALFLFNAHLQRVVQRKTTSLEGEIEERKRAEEDLKENRSTLRQILDTTPQSIFWKDLEGCYLGCNMVFAQAAGFDDPDQIKGKTDFDLPWPKDEALAYRADDLEVIRSNRAKRHIIEPLQQADGSRLWIDTTKVPLVDSQGEVNGVLGVYEDITERKRAEEEREELEKRLRQAQKMESIGTLASGIAHDFNNILTIILGYTELATQEREPDKLAQDLEEIRKGGMRARELVKQILAFSRRTAQSYQPIELSPIIKEAVKMLRASLPTTIEITHKISDYGTVLADPTQIHQVMMNLCINGYHAMRETGGTLSISSTEIELCQEDCGYGDLPPGKYLKIEVSDTGCGITPEVKERIFEPYFTTKKTGDGTGLGLAVAHGIIKNHNGHISVYSEPGLGTTFHLYLPIVDAEPVQLITRGVVEHLTGSGERVMLVDDEVQITEIIKRYLSAEGYHVTAYNSAVQALESFQKDPEQFDLIMTDMTMPCMTGAEFSQRVLNIRPEIPIILCTGQSEIINKEKAYAMGISLYLKKPVLKQELLSAVKKALKTGKQSTRMQGGEQLP